MEKCDYIIRVGNDSKDTTVSAIIRLDHEATVRKVENEMSPDRKLQILRPSSRKTESINAPVVELKAAECITIDGANLIPRKTMTYVLEGTYYKKPTTDSYSEIPFPTKQEVVMVKNHPNATLLDVKQGNVTKEEFIATLDPEV